MSALGQKQTFRSPITMSALPPESGHAAKGKVGRRICNLVHCCRAAIGVMASESYWQLHCEMSAFDPHQRGSRPAHCILIRHASFCQKCRDAFVRLRRHKTIEMTSDRSIPMSLRVLGSRDRQFSKRTTLFAILQITNQKRFDFRFSRSSGTLCRIDFSDHDREFR
jgi:hypothetical protein